MVPERRPQAAREEAPRPRPHARALPQLRSFYLTWGLTVLLAVIVVSRFAAASQTAYALDRTEARLQVAQAQEIALEGQVSALSSAARLEALAPKLHLQPGATALAIALPDARVAASLATAPKRSGGSGIAEAALALIRSIVRMVARM